MHLIFIQDQHIIVALTRRKTCINTQNVTDIVVWVCCDFRRGFFSCAVRLSTHVAMRFHCGLSPVAQEVATYLTEPVFSCGMNVNHLRFLLSKRRVSPPNDRGVIECAGACVRADTITWSVCCQHILRKTTDCFHSKEPSKNRPEHEYARLHGTLSGPLTDTDRCTDKLFNASENLRRWRISAASIARQAILTTRHEVTKQVNIITSRTANDLHANKIRPSFFSKWTGF
jgi:hypothetical protein